MAVIKAGTFIEQHHEYIKEMTGELIKESGKHRDIQLVNQQNQYLPTTRYTLASETKTIISAMNATLQIT